MNPRNLRRTRTALLVPIAALTASVIALEARDGATPTSIQSDAASTASTPGASLSTGAASALAAPTTVSTPPPTSVAPGAVGAPASVTRGAAALGGGLPLLRARAGTPGFSTAADTAATDAIPSVALAAYQRAASVIDQADSGCRLDWQLLAAIGKVESGDGTSGGSQLSTAGVATPAIYGPSLTGRKHTARVPDTDDGAIDGDKRFDRAVGPMQILPATWVQIAVDGDGDGRRDPQDINDAALASAVYLCSTGTDLSDTAARRAALLRYNHSASYAAEVLAIAATYTSDDQSTTIPATLLLPPDGGSPTPAATPSGGADGARHTNHKHAKHGHHHGATGLKADAGGPQGTQQGPQQPTTTQPTKPTKPTEPTKPAVTPAATAAQLEGLCRPAIVRTYPDATDDAVDAATAECVTKLTGRTLTQARAQLDDLVADPDLAADVPDLGPAVSATPSGEPSSSPTSDPTESPTDGTSADPSSPATDPSASATATPSGGSGTASATSTAR